MLVGSLQGGVAGWRRWWCLRGEGLLKVRFFLSFVSCFFFNIIFFCFFISFVLKIIK